jgi:hypothetical protein
VGSEFPRTYRQTRAYRGSMYACGIALAAGALVGIGYAFAMEDQAGGLPALIVFGCVPVLLGGIAMILSGAGTRVVLQPDAIEVHGLWRTKRMVRTEIAGRRAHQMESGGPGMRLLPRYTSDDSLALPQSLKTDAEFYAWFADIPDVDAKERQASLDEYLRDNSEAGSAEEKMQRLRNAARVSRYFAWITIAVFFWVAVYPHPYDPAVLIAAMLPWLAAGLSVARGSVYRLDTTANDVRINLFPTLVLPGFALMLRATFDSDLLDWGRAVWMTAVGGIAGIGLCVIFVRELRTQRASQVALSMLILPYSYGVVVLGNMKLDSADADQFRTQVLDASIDTSNGRRFNLRLAPWGPRSEAEEVDVGQAFYKRTTKGDTVCVYVHRGAFAIRWFEVWDCPSK